MPSPGAAGNSRPAPLRRAPAARPTRRQQRLSRTQRDARLRRALIVGGGVLAALVILVLGFGLLRENVLRPRETAAVAFGRQITLGELAERTKPRLAGLDNQIAFLRSQGNQQAAQLTLQRSRMPETVLSIMIEEEAVRREAMLRGLTVSQGEVEEKIRKEVARLDALSQPPPPTTPTPTLDPAATPGTPTPVPTATPVPTLSGDAFGPAYDSLLLRTGYSDAAFRQAMEADLWQEKLRKALADEVPKTQEQVRARHIVLGSEEKAKEILQRLEQGESFEALARAESTVDKDKAGDMGWLVRGLRDPAFENAVFQLEPGQRSGVIPSERGFEIVEFLEQSPAQAVSEPDLEALARRRYSEWQHMATGDPQIDRQLDGEKSAWVLRLVSGGRRA